MSDSDRYPRGSSVPTERLDRLPGDTLESEPMPPRIEAATDVHKLRDHFSREVQRIERGLDHRLRTMETMVIGTDVAPGVYSMVVDMTKTLTQLRVEIREDRKRAHDDQRWRDLIAYGSAGATLVCALMILVLLLR